MMVCAWLDETTLNRKLSRKFIISIMIMPSNRFFCCCCFWSLSSLVVVIILCLLPQTLQIAIATPPSAHHSTIHPVNRAEPSSLTSSTMLFLKRAKQDISQWFPSMARGCCCIVLLLEMNMYVFSFTFSWQIPSSKILRTSFPLIIPSELS